MKHNFIRIVFFLLITSIFAQADKVSVLNDDDGMKLVVNGEHFMINGMNWDYFPIGTNFSYSLWKQSDDVIKAASGRRNGIVKKYGGECHKTIHRSTAQMDKIHL